MKPTTIRTWDVDELERECWAVLRRDPQSVPVFLYNLPYEERGVYACVMREVWNLACYAGDESVVTRQGDAVIPLYPDMLDLLDRLARGTDLWTILRKQQLQTSQNNFTMELHNCTIGQLFEAGSVNTFNYNGTTAHNAVETMCTSSHRGNPTDTSRDERIASSQTKQPCGPQGDEAMHSSLPHRLQGDDVHIVSTAPKMFSYLRAGLSDEEKKSIMNDLETLCHNGTGVALVAYIIELSKEGKILIENIRPSVIYNELVRVFGAIKVSRLAVQRAFCRLL